MDPPREPGTYLLELGLISEHVVWFSETMTSPLNIVVDVKTDPRLAFSRTVERLRVPTPDAPSLVLSSDRTDDAVRLTVTTSVDQRSWTIDAYLALEGPAGALWFYDGQRLVPHQRGAWTPLGKRLRLDRGTRGSATLLSLPTTGMRLGTYTWHLLLTEAYSYRIVAHATTQSEVTP